ncbi:DUF4307 domain-containing protein [Corynebacterium freiburgense]|uniref:DUF4307 domain-containing protein n=1 Tax=Corynebacterium freiburgense TaxID=556548 RepID=UPI0004248BA3|nr:DUF4307 domain-containing protein [Corynebacterium freiburgense]WJZ02185.1 hypothetical protein CFREI_04445 [Corynebacterium freiburgense]
MSESLRANRYATDPKKGTLSGKIIAIGAVIFAVVAVVVIVQYFQKINGATVTASQAGFERIDDRTLKISVDVTRKNIDEPSYCIVTALNYDKAEVGRREFRIEPGGNQTERFQVNIPTRDLPVAGTVYGCHTNVPSYLTEGS